MSVRPRRGAEVPELTARVARAANPKGTTAMWVRDRLEGLWSDEDFVGWCPRDGRPALSPAQLATVCVLQFLYNLSDRDLQTVRRFADASTVEELLVKAENRATKLDGWLDLVNQRWNDGVTNAAVIHAELRERGFTGDIQTVRRYLKPLRHRGDGRKPGPTRKAPAVLAVPKPGHISRWLLTHPDHLDEEHALEVKKATAACQHLEALHGHIRVFAAIMTERRGADDLPAWLDAVEADELPALHSLATGMRRDLDAVIHGLTLEHNSGAVKGAVTRAKALKRQCYGRANFDLLRRRILLTP
jgi:transposase